MLSLGLSLVIVGGAELFTGNALMVTAAVERKISMRQLLRSWAVVYAGNFVGAFGLLLLSAPPAFWMAQWASSQQKSLSRRRLCCRLRPLCAALCVMR
ncbi:formate/nitrite transporter family protein [Roseovarius sp. S4756]|uniref:formate/nitrite transporter family protein n=1 Tax=Roseovarius maritimus TaxID=3342637 RepID=UPI003B67DDC9